VTDLETRLVALGQEVSFPPTPDLVATVETTRAPRARRWPRVAIAIALLAAAFGALLAASPGARSALRDLFGIGGVEIVQVGEAPPAAGRLVPFGHRVTLAEAQQAAGFRIRTPAARDGLPPAGVYLGGRPERRIVSLVWCCAPRIVLSEFRSGSSGLLQKLIGRATAVDDVTVGAAPALWVTGSDHVLRLLDSRAPPVTVRVHGGVLIWESGPLTLRLEGELSKERALAIARGIS
jgi:hypothetical protein